MEKDQHGGSEKVLYKTKGRLRLEHKEPEEVDCLVTENHVVMQAEEPMKIPLSRIQECEESLYVPVTYTRNFQEERYGTVTLTFSDDENKKRKLSLDVAFGEEKPLKRAIGRQMLGGSSHEAEERDPDLARGLVRGETPQGFILDLRKVGAKARMAPRGRIEEDIGEFHALDRCLGVIEIAEGFVRWVTVWSMEVVSSLSGHREPIYSFLSEYGVPDPRLQPDSPPIRIVSVPVKTRRVFGKVVDLRWEGEDSDLGIIRRLNGDEELKRPIMESGGVRIRAYGDYGCWLICSPGEDSLSGPSPELWHCYQAIAQHLLADWPTQ